MTNVNTCESIVVTVSDEEVITVRILDVGPQGPAGPAGLGVPTGGTDGQLLAKVGSDNYVSEWTSDPHVDSLSFNTAAAVDPISTGQLAWSVDEGTLELGKGAVTNYIGQETIVLCRNASNTVSIPKGTAVMFAGTLGASGRIKVAPMVANGTYPGYVFFGVTDQAIAGASDGYVSVFGKIRGINTSAYSNGDILWCNPAVPGGFTLVEPVAPNLKLAVAAVVNAGNNGTIFVRWTTGARLQDLHDVEANGSKVDRDVLTYIAANNRWEARQASFSYTQSTPASVWTINHNLGFKPSVELFDTGSQEIDGEVIHTSVNQAVVTFTKAIAGFSRLN